MAFQHRARAIDLSVADVGKTIKSTKKRVKFSFVFDGDEDEHILILTHSVISGKKQIALDGVVIHKSEEKVLGEFSHSFQCDRHLCELLIDGTDYEYDLRIDGRAFRRLSPTTILDARALARTMKDAAAGKDGSVKEAKFSDFVKGTPASSASAAFATAPAADVAGGSAVGSSWDPFGGEGGVPDDTGTGLDFGDAGGFPAADSMAAAPAAAGTVAIPARSTTNSSGTFDPFGAGPVEPAARATVETPTVLAAPTSAGPTATRITPSTTDDDLFGLAMGTSGAVPGTAVAAAGGAMDPFAPVAAPVVVAPSTAAPPLPSPSPVDNSDPWSVGGGLVDLTLSSRPVARPTAAPVVAARRASLNELAGSTPPRAATTAMPSAGPVFGGAQAHAMPASMTQHGGAMPLAGGQAMAPATSGHPGYSTGGNPFAAGGMGVATAVPPSFPTGMPVGTSGFPAAVTQHGQPAARAASFDPFA